LNYRDTLAYHTAMHVTVTTAQPDEFQEITDLWEASVRATHHFISEDDIGFFKPLVRDTYLAAVELRCARNGAGDILGFVGVAEAKIEMLFVSPTHFGQGIGTRLLRQAIDSLGATLVDVNEQNPRGIGFYEHHGFERIGRSPLDGTGRPYPLLHMRLRSGAETPA
jgi:Acetyltransferases